MAPQRARKRQRFCLLSSRQGADIVSPSLKETVSSSCRHDRTVYVKTRTIDWDGPTSLSQTDVNRVRLSHLFADTFPIRDVTEGAFITQSSPVMSPTDMEASSCYGKPQKCLNLTSSPDYSCNVFLS